jgi:hypothetical protein
VKITAWNNSGITGASWAGLRLLPSLPHSPFERAVQHFIDDGGAVRSSPIATGQLIARLDVSSQTRRHPLGAASFDFRLACGQRALDPAFSAIVIRSRVGFRREMSHMPLVGLINHASVRRFAGPCCLVLFALVAVVDTAAAD